MEKVGRTVEPAGDGRQKSLARLRVDHPQIERCDQYSCYRRRTGKNAGCHDRSGLLGLFLSRTAVVGKRLITGVPVRRTLAAGHAIGRVGFPSGASDRRSAPECQDDEHRRSDPAHVAHCNAEAQSSRTPWLLIRK